MTTQLITASYQCQQCGKVFTTAAEWKAHQDEHHAQCSHDYIKISDHAWIRECHINPACSILSKIASVSETQF